MTTSKHSKPELIWLLYLLPVGFLSGYAFSVVCDYGTLYTNEPSVVWQLKAINVLGLAWLNFVAVISLVRIAQKKYKQSSDILTAGVLGGASLCFFSAFVLFMVGA